MTARDIRWLLIARGSRAFGDGFVSLLLPVYLLTLGFTPSEVGIIATGTLLGSGVLTVLAGLHAHRFHLRTLLLAATTLTIATGAGFATITGFWPLLVVAIVGTLNPSSGDVSVFLPLEHAMLAKLAPDRQRTGWFARYSLVGALLAAAGALAAGAPEWLAPLAQVPPLRALQAMFALYACLGLLSAAVYRRLPRDPSRAADRRAVPLRQAKRTVYTLAALFSLDALGGGLIVQSMLALWLFERYQLSIATAGVIFFWTGVFSAFSYLVAVKIADRIGLVYTMVFTHLPSSVLLILVAFAPGLGWAIALLLLRSALSQMDVPTRSSFVMAVVPPEERAAAASVTSVPRSLASAVSPMVAGYLLGASTFGWPLIIAGGLKITYDLLLLRLFRRLSHAR